MGTSLLRIMEHPCGAVRTWLADMIRTSCACVKTLRIRAGRGVVVEHDRVDRRVPSRTRKEVQSRHFGQHNVAERS
jgi:hypothetical protein